MSSVSDEQVPVTLCAEGAERQPPKHDWCFCEKRANYFPLPLTPLECPYKNVHGLNF